MTTKLCAYQECRKILNRRPTEVSRDYHRRRFCNRSCAGRQTAIARSRNGNGSSA